MSRTFFDFSIYVDADEKDIEHWFVERFLTLRDTVFTDKSSYFHRYADITTEEAREVAGRIWREINGVNLKENIIHTRHRARLILEKGRDHSSSRGEAAKAVNSTGAGATFQERLYYSEGPATCTTHPPKAFLRPR